MKKKRKTVKEEMLEYMKNRYNEEFECVYIGSESWSSPFIEMIVHSEKFTKERIVVNKSGSVMSDNYTDFLMKDKIEKEMNEIVSKIYPESKVFYRGGGMPYTPELVNPEMSIVEYSKSRYLPLSIKLCIYDPDYELNKDIKLEELRKILEYKKYKSDLLIFYVIKDKLDSINSNTWHDLLTGPNKLEWTTLRGSFNMDDNYKFEYTEWRKLK